MAVARLASVSN